MEVATPSLLMSFNAIFDEKRRLLARTLLHHGFEHYLGSCLLWKGKKPVVEGLNHVVRTMGFGRIKTTAKIVGEIRINEWYLGMFSNLSIDLNARVRGDVCLKKAFGSNVSLKGKLRLKVMKTLDGSLTILDRSDSVHLAKDMKITLACPNLPNVRIEICDKSPQTGFSLKVTGPGIWGFTHSNNVKINFFEDKGTGVYRINLAK